MLSINDFSSIIQLAATLNIAFVAVEYSKSYTHFLSYHVFKFDKNIEEGLYNARLFLQEKVSLNNIPTFKIGETNTQNLHEDLKRKMELFEETITKKELELKSFVNTKCNSRSLSSLSLYLFFYCMTLLILGGIERFCPVLIKYELSFLTILSFTYLALGWIYGEIENRKENKGTKIKLKIKFCNCFISIKYTIYIFIFIILLSSLITFFFRELPSSVLRAVITLISIEDNNIERIHVCNNYIWTFILILSSLMTFSNFISYFLKTRQKAKTINLKIKETSNILDIQSEPLRKNVSNLIAGAALNELILFDNTPENTTINIDQKIQH